MLYDSLTQRLVFRGKRLLGAHAIALGTLLLCGCNLFTASDLHDMSMAPGDDAARDAGQDLRVSDATTRPDAQDLLDLSAPGDAAVLRDISMSDASSDAAGASDMTDVAPDVEVCIPESSQELCARLAKDCGTLSATDNCQLPRSGVECGTCIVEICGAETPNVCGCPCNIDGVCYLENEQHPSDPCLSCQPTVSLTAWSVDEGAACDDANPCSADSACDAAGACIPLDADRCDTLTVECNVGSCDTTTMSCMVEFAPDGTSCSDDGLSCTADSCVAGACEHELLPGFCLIGGGCYAPGAANPLNPCLICTPSVSTSSWTNASEGFVCNPSPACECDGGGECLKVSNDQAC